MRVLRLGGGLAVAWMLVACQVDVRTGPGSVPPPTMGGGGGGARPAPAPAPMPHNVPPPVANNPPPPPLPSNPNAGKPPPPMTVANAPLPPGTPAHHVSMLRRMAIRQIAPQGHMAVQVNRNVLHLQALKALRVRTPSPCGPQEVVPDKFVHIDCARYTAVPNAKFVAPARRLNLFMRGHLRSDQNPTGTGGPSPAHGPPGGTGDVPQSIPATVDHRTDGTEGPVKDQGEVGSCTAFSLSTTLDNAIKRLNKTDVASPMHIWSHYAFPNMSNAGDANVNRPLATQVDWPYDEPLACRMYKGGDGADGCGGSYSPPVVSGTGLTDPVVQAKIKDVDGKGKYQITNVTRIFDGNGTADTDGFVAALASGKDIWVAFTLNMNAWGMKGASSGEIPDYPAINGGGHAIVVSGYRTKNGVRQFLIHNSWSEQWGGPEKGYAWVSDAMVKQSCYDAYTIAATDLTAPPPPPPPPPPQPNGTCPAGFVKTSTSNNCLKVCTADSGCDSGSSCAKADTSMVCVANNPLTDDDCADDELVDGVTNKCALMCPNDTRQENGVCATSATGGGHPPPPPPPRH